MPKIVDHDKYRQEMLEKCFYFFGRNGYSNITMEDIADEIGVSKGTLYHYFPSKENMLRELISWAGIKNVSEYERRTSSIDSIDDRVDQIVFVLKESGEFYRNIMLLAVDMYRNTDIEQVKELYVFFSENFIGMISGRLNVSRELADSIFIHVIGVIFKRGADLHFIPYKNIETLSGAAITLNSFDCWRPWEEDDSFMVLNRDILDEQIFDVEGIRVVRIGAREHLQPVRHAIAVGVERGVLDADQHRAGGTE